MYTPKIMLFHFRWDRQKMSKVVVVGDLNVGKTCLINRYFILKKYPLWILREYNSLLEEKTNLYTLIHCFTLINRSGLLE